jgi:hypothetical protein
MGIDPTDFGMPKREPAPSEGQVAAAAEEPAGQAEAAEPAEQDFPAILRFPGSNGPSA